MPGLTDILDAKTPVPLALPSGVWDVLQADIKELASWLAQVDDVRRVQQYRDTARRILSGSLTRAEARSALRRLLATTGYKAPAGKENTIHDLSSEARQNISLDTACGMVAGYADRELRKGSMAYPAQRLVRVAPRREPRGDWPQRWARACSEVGYEGCCAQEMVALTLSPVWAALSRFGTPYPPFDYGSGMGVRPVSYSEAERLGLATAEAMQAVRNVQPGRLTEGIKADCSTLDADLRAGLSRKLGGRARWDGNTLVWEETTE